MSLSDSTLALVGERPVGEGPSAPGFLRALGLSVTPAVSILAETGSHGTPPPPNPHAHLFSERLPRFHIEQIKKIP